MLKNKEFVMSVMLQVIVLLILVVLLRVHIVDSIYIVLLGGVVMIGIHIWYTRRRYQEMKKLTEYISSFQYGKESLDLLDNREGELSILKNQLYKNVFDTSSSEGIIKEGQDILSQCDLGYLSSVKDAAYFHYCNGRFVRAAGVIRRKAKRVHEKYIK